MGVAFNNLRTKLCGPQRDNARAGVAGYSVSVCTMVGARPTNREISLLGGRGVVVFVVNVRMRFGGCAQSRRFESPYRRMAKGAQGCVLCEERRNRETIKRADKKGSGKRWAVNLIIGTIA